MRARMYDPRLGRFTQTDPVLGNRPGKHYSYGDNNPVSMIDPWGLDVDAAWGPYATRDAIKRGDWRKIDRLRYDSYAESKFRDLETLYNAYDKPNWWTRNVWDAQGASQEIGSIAQREGDLNRILKEGPWAVKHDEATKAHTLAVAVETYVPIIAAAASAPSAVQSAFANANAALNASLEAAQMAAQSARGATALSVGAGKSPAPFKIALGTQETLGDFARQQGALPHWEWDVAGIAEEYRPGTILPSGRTAFEQQFTNAMNTAGSKGAPVLFDLTGVNPTTFRGSSSAFGKDNMTNAEIRAIMGNKAWWKNTQWYHDGELQNAQQLRSKWGIELQDR